MIDLKAWIGQRVEIEVSGGIRPILGTLIDTGMDILVVRQDKQYVYLPFLHLQSVKQAPSEAEQSPGAGDPPFEDETENLTYRKVLLNAKGIFAELYVTGRQPVHGYITSVMNDYFVFHSPMFPALLVPLNHLKYLVPYKANTTPFSITRDQFPVQPVTTSLARTFELQLKKLEGRFVVMDLGTNPNRAGLLKKVENMLIELVTANQGIVYFHLNHVKTVHLP